MRVAIHLVFLVWLPVAAIAQDADSDPFGPVDDVDTKTSLPPEHPSGETPQARMFALAHTDALPKFDRIELFAVSFPKGDPFGDAQPKQTATDNTFPVHPYSLHADIHDHVSLKGTICEEIRALWTSLEFDRLGGAFCHYPAYGFRLYRDDLLLFETTVCWQCSNFYIPEYDEKKQRETHHWYGFSNDDTAKALLKLFQSHLPHPNLKE